MPRVLLADAEVVVFVQSPLARRNSDMQHYYLLTALVVLTGTLIGCGVNGAMHLQDGADVGGRVENVNGHIVLAAAHVAGGLRTVGGDIDVTGSSRVEGGIVVEKSSGWFNWNTRRPRIVIGPAAAIQGPLRFEREVRLYVSDRATIGPVTGATVIRFSGDKPSE